ncbi:hypothetical protein BN946_scf184910.g17 [Trametes cinnabarina]|uniref:DNA/RNA-binding domain-containing protein n=1 Tax=Pycnoporus cinnabarinus TaxID=5643 RepID=A0A060SGG8_PYCCI|nr:hypothetical protein BN946_scf184910.g17 [Trametes cinnabarina]
MRDYRKAQQCYQQARLLLPQDGNPAHQLAIIASYQKDTFSSLVHYYRALCVRSPYDTAADNLGTVLAKALESWTSRGAKKEKEREKEQARGETSLAPRLRIEAFKERLIVLHALWSIPPEEAHTIAPNLAQKVAEDFKSLVSDRVLPSDIISNVVVLAQGALWKHRMFRNPSSNGHRRNMHAGAATAIESAIAGHLLAVHRVLLEVGIVQIAEAPTEDTAEHDLAQRITAEFRRTLPALRTGSKWLRANLRYLSQAWQQLVASEEGEGPPAKPKSRDRRRGSDRRSSGGSGTAVAPGLREFWRTYAHFSTVLRRAFPQDRLPKTTTTLEEDVEMAGFQPLKRFVLSEVVSVVGVAKDAPKEGSNNGAAHNGFRMVQPEQVHPNEEQLMRIADLLSDAVSLARDDICPLQVSGGRFSVQEPPRRPEPRPTQPRQQPRPEPRHPRPQESPQRRIPERLSPQVPMRPTYDVCAMGQQEEDGMTDVTRTEDDPVGDAFREALGAPSDAGDEDDEQILWPRAQPAPPPLPHDPAIVTAMPANAGATVPSPPRAIDPSPALPTSGPRSPLSLSPIAPPGRSAEATPALSLGTPQKPATTAQEILANLQRGPPKADVTRSLHARQASAPAFHALFPNSLGGGPSIWSSDESDGLVFQGAAGALSGSHYQSYQLSNGLPQNQSQHNHVRHASSSLYPVQPSLSVEQAPLAPPRPFPGLTNAGLSHQRVQSLSMNNNTQFLSSIPGPHLFSSSQSQPPVPEGFGSYPALSEQSTVPYSTGVPGAYADPVYSRKTDTGFARRDAPGYPDRSVPYHVDPRTNDGHAGFSLSTMAQLWNNTG